MDVWIPRSRPQSRHPRTTRPGLNLCWYKLKAIYSKNVCPKANTWRVVMGQPPVNQTKAPHLTNHWIKIRRPFTVYQSIYMWLDCLQIKKQREARRPSSNRTDPLLQTMQIPRWRRRKAVAWGMDFLHIRWWVSQRQSQCQLLNRRHRLWQHLEDKGDLSEWTWKEEQNLVDLLTCSNELCSRVNILAHNRSG